MSPNRPDSITPGPSGAPADAEVMAILARAGARMTDSLELFRCPPSIQPRLLSNQFWMHGYRHMTPRNMRVCFGFRPRAPVRSAGLRKPQDSNAIRLHTQDDVFVVGFPVYDSRHVPPVIAAMVQCYRRARSTRIRHNPAEAAVPSSKFWPDDFIPCGGESYQPSRPRLGVSMLAGKRLRLTEHPQAIPTKSRRRVFSFGHSDFDLFRRSSFVIRLPSASPRAGAEEAAGDVLGFMIASMRATMSAGRQPGPSISPMSPGVVKLDA